jgi:hypothetical protein
MRQISLKGQIKSLRSRYEELIRAQPRDQATNIGSQKLSGLDAVTLQNHIKSVTNEIE